MKNETVENSSIASERLVSLDFFRGLTMLLLFTESTELYSHLADSELEGTALHWLGTQFHHVAWDGLRFWDLIQPFFMFIVGVAMPFSLSSRTKAGLGQSRMTRHALKRSLLLLFLGWAIHCIYAGEIEYKFQNVLAQLGVTYMLAYLIMRQSFRFQLLFSLALLALTELLYRGFPVEGFNHAFTPNENFGTWLDLQYGGANLQGHWVSFNAIPTAAHTIWGVLAGQLLLSSRTGAQKLKILVVAGLIGVVAGYGLSPLTPIVKRISTSTFVLASGGWSLLALALSYGLIDVLKQKKWAFFFVVVGMNPLFIYLFCHVGGAEIAKHIATPLVSVLFGSGSEKTFDIALSLATLSLLWYLCYWLYKKKIFFKI